MAETSVLPTYLETPIVGKGPNNTYKWPIYEDEEARLTEMLGVDFKSFDIGGTFVTVPQLGCEQCNKLSGLDDFIHEALADGIHSKEFILRILDRVGSDNVRASPPHRLNCMNCHIYYKHAQKAVKSPTSFSWSPVNDDSPDSVKGEVALIGWPSTFGWTNDIKERDADRNRQIDEYNALKAQESGQTAPSNIERDLKTVLAAA